MLRHVVWKLYYFAGLSSSVALKILLTILLITYDIESVVCLE